jgi:hypothetical protein
MITPYLDLIDQEAFGILQAFICFFHYFPTVLMQQPALIWPALTGHAPYEDPSSQHSTGHSDPGET